MRLSLMTIALLSLAACNASREPAVTNNAANAEPTSGATAQQIIQTVNQATGVDRVVQDQKAMATIQPSIDAAYDDAKKRRDEAEAAAQ